MSEPLDQEHQRVRHLRLRQTAYQVTVALCGLVLAVGLSRWLDARRPPPDPRAEEENLYLNGKTARRMSLGFNGMVADWYWMRSLQYVGRKIIAQPGNAPLDDLKSLNLTMLYPLLDNATTLDPQFITAYEYGGIVLPAIDRDAAVKLLKKGVEANPTAWRLYQHLGYLYWKEGDFTTASKYYGEGAAQPGAPQWMKQMQARVLGEGDSRDTAREIYRQMMDQSPDEHIKEMAALRILQIDSFDDRDAIQPALDQYQARHGGQCPAAWRDTSAELRAAKVLGKQPLRFDQSGAPLDPTGVPYRLRPEIGCKVDLDWTKSKIPYK
jgi:tetratricopeptide (TPR) repeat protein